MPEEITAYRCEHCGSKFVRLTKHAVKQHEKWCYSRPENVPACWNGCVHYEHKNTEDCGPGEPPRTIWHYCQKHDREMESMKMKVKRDSDGFPWNRYPLMPVECPDFDDGYKDYDYGSGGGIDGLFAGTRF